MTAGPFSAPHAELVRVAVGHVLPIANRFGLLDPHDEGQVASFVERYEDTVLQVIDGEAAATLAPGDGLARTDAEIQQATATAAAAHVLYLAMWARCAFPHVVFSTAKLLATYAFTKASISAVGAVCLPWRAFSIDLNPGDLTVEDSYVQRITVMARKLIPYCPVEIGTHLASGESMHVMVSQIADDDELPFRDPLHGPERAAGLNRCMAVVRRIVANVVLALTNQGNYERRVRTLGEKGSYARRMCRLPQTEQYVLGRSVTVNVDLRRELRDFLERGDPAVCRGPVAVQTLVSGHGKWQVCSPGRLGRKWIFIQPYWRGPEDAPIVVRPHSLGEDSAEPCHSQPLGRGAR